MQLHFSCQATAAPLSAPGERPDGTAEPRRRQQVDAIYASSREFNPESGRIDDVGGNLILSFSEAVYSDSSGTAFTAAALAGVLDLREDNESGTPIPFTVSIDQDNDTVTIDPTGTLPLRAWVHVNNGYYDTVGNAGTKAMATFTVDTIRPTVMIDGVPPTDSGGFVATFTFSEAVTGFTAGDVAVTNGTASVLTEAGDALQWRLRITPTGDYRVTLPADRVTDLAGNGNAASVSREGSYGADVTDPRVADIVRSSPGREHTNQDEVAWTVTFSEPVRNLSAGDFTVPGTDATLTVTQEGSGSRTWNVIASGGDLARLNTTIRLSFAGTRDIEDAAGNLLAAIAPTGADENTFVIDSVAPALTSIVRQPPKGSPADAETATWRPDVQRTHAGDRRDRLRGPRREDCRGGGRLEGGLRPFGVRRRRHPRSSPDQRVHQQRERHPPSSHRAGLRWSQLACLPSRGRLHWRRGEDGNAAGRRASCAASPERRAAGVPRLQAPPPAARADRPLRRTAGVLGGGYGDRLDLRSGHAVPRTGCASPDAAYGHDRGGARFADRVLRLDGPVAARRARRAAAHHAGGRVGVPASGAREVAGARHDRRRG